MSAGPVVWPQPDVEAHLWAQLAALPGVTAWCYDAAPMALVPWSVEYAIQVDCRAGSKAAAWQLAERARRQLWQLAYVPWPAGVISYTQITDGPLWQADDDGTPRYVLRVTYRAHPARDLAAPLGLPGTDTAGRVGKKEHS